MTAIASTDTRRAQTSRPRPVLMIPLRRCGSHALRLRLNFNADFYSPYPLHIVDFMPLVPLYGDLEDDRTYFRLRCSRPSVTKRAACTASSGSYCCVRVSSMARAWSWTSRSTACTTPTR